MESAVFPFFSTKCLTKCGECAISKPIPQKWKYVEDRGLHLSIDIEKNRQTNVENDARWLPVICLTIAEEPLYGRRRSSLAISAAQSSIRSVARAESAIYASGDSVCIVARSYTR